MFFVKVKKRGFLVLTMVLLVSAVVLAIATGVMLRSIGEVNSSLDMENSVKAWGSVNACAEYALLQLSTTSSGLAGWNYASTTGELKTDIDGSGNSCYIYKIEPFFATSTDCLNPLKRCIRASSTVPSVGPGFTRKLLIEVATNTPIVTVDSWSEVADF